MNEEIKAGDIVAVKLFVKSVITNYKGEKEYQLCILDKMKVLGFNTITVTDVEIICTKATIEMETL